MFAPKPVARGSQEYIRREKLVSKLLFRIITQLENAAVSPTPDMLDKARAQLMEKWKTNGNLTISDSELRAIAHQVSGLKKSKTPALTKAERQAVLSVPTAAKPQPADTRPKNDDIVDRPCDEHPPDPLMTPSRTREALANTTKKQREMLADEEWIQAMEEDRRRAIDGKKEERMQHMSSVGRQRGVLEQQIEEHRQEKEAWRREQRRLQQEMTDLIDHNRALTRKEKEDAFNKAMREKQFREEQQNERERQREMQRTLEHNEQVRQCMMARMELQKQREGELDRKKNEKKEWKKVLEDNAQRLNEREKNREMERRVDQQFQKEYEDRLDQQDRERAEAKARKQQRQEYFKNLADGVAKMFMRKEQDLGAKIEREYSDQQRRAIEDENNRKKRNKERTRECQIAIRDQLAEKKRLDDEEREEARRFAQKLRDQAAEAQHQEECRKMAARAEALRMQRFLNTQLQMQHFKETMPLETSIARPASRAKTMYSPSRYTPSIRTDAELAEN